MFAASDLLANKLKIEANIRIARCEPLRFAISGDCTAEEDFRRVFVMSAARPPRFW